MVKALEHEKHSIRLLMQQLKEQNDGLEAENQELREG
jgi:hypothetical protein